MKNKLPQLTDFICRKKMYIIFICSVVQFYKEEILSCEDLETSFGALLSKYPHKSRNQTLYLTQLILKAVNKG